MKKLSKTILALLSACLVSTVFAGEEASDDSARHYKSHPEQYDGQSVDVDCAFVKRINGGPQVPGVAFFVAHTFDDKNKMHGGSIVIAVLEADASSFASKYGNIPDRERNKNSTADRVDTKRLDGTFHQLAKGHVYIDESGNAHELIQEKLEEAKGKIRAGDGIPSGANTGRPHPKHKKRL
ncbi:MAG: hypothetical protein ACPGJU_01735 [Coraliomargarita sp.]